MDASPIFINGLDRIAQALGVSEKTLRKDFLSLPGFPARQLKVGGPWVSTREKLALWADLQIPDPASEPAFDQPA